MMPMRPDQADFLRHVLIATFENEHTLTRRVIEAIPPGKADFRPDAVVKSAFDLAWHIVSAEDRFLSAVASGAFEYGQVRPDHVKSVADIVSWYEAAFAREVARVKAMPPEALVTPIDFRGILRFPAVMYLQLGLSHSVHHRGQLSMYLRPMGAKVPSIYGESYDATQARLAVEPQRL